MMKFIEYAINENFDFGTQPEVGKVFIEDDGEADDEWKLALDISKIWKQYEDKDISAAQFNQKYSKFLEGNKSQILKFVVEDKEQFEEIIQKLKDETDINKSETLWNSMYDICDKNEILLKA